MADRDYEKSVPEALKDVELPDSGKESIPADSAVSPWKNSSEGILTKPSAHGTMLVYKRNRGSGKRDLPDPHDNQCHGGGTVL